MSQIVSVASPYTATLITDTTAFTGPFVAFQVLTDAVFTVLTGLTVASGSTIAGGTFPKGAVIPGVFSACTLASGSIVVYAPTRT